ncbi:MAG: nitroreductase, partial [Chitinivibrionales bacterium]|nr:nitroreductase [Chitinivibrionales bacterium]
MLKDIVMKSRSIRRFDESAAIARRTLEQLVDIVRYCPSGGNKQPLRYLLIDDRRTNALVFPCISWAGHLKDWPGPDVGQRPAAYVILLGDTSITTTFGVDHGIAAQTLMLAAAERGLGGCIIGAMNRSRLRRALAIDSRYELLLMVALGVPAEAVTVDSIDASGDTRYYRGADGIHHVPKVCTAQLM